jgi:hypothetical protein
MTATPAPAGRRSARPAHWFPLALFGALIAVPVPLYALPLFRPMPSGWASYAPVDRSVFWSSGGGAYGSTVLITFDRHSWFPGIPEGWYWAAALATGFLLLAAWYRRAARRDGAARPGWGHLAAGLALAAAIAAAPLLSGAATLPAMLWLDEQWNSGTFALLAVAAGLGLLAWRVRSRTLGFIVLAFTAAVLVFGWPAILSAGPAFTGGSALPLPLPQRQPFLGDAALLLPAAVLLVAAATVFALPWLRRRKTGTGAG